MSFPRQELLDHNQRVCSIFQLVGESDLSLQRKSTDILGVLQTRQVALFVEKRDCSVLPQVFHVDQEPPV